MPTINMIPSKDDDGKEVFEPGGSALQLNIDSWEPPTPYATMEEYNAKLEEFLLLQEELFSISNPRLEVPVRPTNLLSSGIQLGNHDIEAIVATYYGTLFGRGTFTHPLQYDEPVLQKVFGVEWKKKAFFQVAPVDEEDIWDFSQRNLRKIFERHKILFTWTKKDRRTYHNYLIDKRNFSDEELDRVVRSGVDLYRVLDFSTHFYGGRFFMPNPCGDFMATLRLILGSLASRVQEPENLPPEINSSIVLGWYPTHIKGERCLRVNMPYTDYAGKMHTSGFKVSNVDWQVHREDIVEGTNVWCMREPHNERYALLLSTD